MQIAPASRAPALARDASSGPWWRYGIVWFALAGPSIVVVAGFITLFIAFRHADTVIPELPAPAVGAAVATPPSVRSEALPTAPAMVARNHAATPPRAPEPR